MLLVNVLGLGLIVWIVWWFWLYKTPPVSTEISDLVITVADGIYQPASLRVPANQAQTLTFIRKDASPCAETVVFPEFDLSETLSLEKAVAVRLPPMKAGHYAFHCQMQMYKGELTVEEV
ncbi:Cupredoxin-like domain-containing protein [Alteromonadaceae bacterium 2753L.S.0a.02]|nr:Cupredoxin-like domain-containing protein [Alteromonadaceae bacterium 2753L.S.0a.02]